MDIKNAQKITVWKGWVHFDQSAAGRCQDRALSQQAAIKVSSGDSATCHESEMAQCWDATLREGGSPGWRFSFSVVAAV